MVNVPVSHLRTSWSSWTLEGVLSDETVNTSQSFRFSLSIDSKDSEFVLLVLGQSSNLNLAVGSRGSTTWNPSFAVALDTLNNVVEYGAASVILWRIPSSCATISTNIVNPHWTLGFAGMNHHVGLCATLCATMVVLCTEGEGASISSLQVEDSQFAGI